MSTPPAAASCLTIARDDGVLRLTKTNPKSGYGISIAMWQALTAAFEGARVDPSVRAIVIDAGGRGFHRGVVMGGSDRGQHYSCSVLAGQDGGGIAMRFAVSVHADCEKN
jgi:enoyl-CoA hydratase/carnithine racemase